MPARDLLKDEFVGSEFSQPPGDGFPVQTFMHIDAQPGSDVCAILNGVIEDVHVIRLPSAIIRECDFSCKNS